MAFMQVESDLQRVGNAVFNKGGNLEDERAWLRIKEQFKEFLKTSHNKQSTPCIHSFMRSVGYPDTVICVYCDARFDIE